jgi:citrate lyase synthetase
MSKNKYKTKEYYKKFVEWIGFEKINSFDEAVDVAEWYEAKWDEFVEELKKKDNMAKNE